MRTAVSSGSPTSHNTVNRLRRQVGMRPIKASTNATGLSLQCSQAVSRKVRQLNNCSDPTLA